MLNRRKVTIGVSALMLVAGIAIVIAALLGVGAGSKGRTIPPPQSFDLPRAVTPAPEPTQAQPTPQPSDAPVTRLIIPKIKVDAGIEVLGLDSSGAMQDPKGYFDVGWYDLSNSFPNFSSKPGWGGNAVFAGHVDCAACGPGGSAGAAVFWRLRELGPDDQIIVQLADGTQYTYHLTSIYTVTPNDAGTYDTSIGTTVSINDLVGPAGKEVVTLITCGGTFNTRTHEYDKRLIVRAERDPQPNAVGAGG